ncbi:MAG: hypothetical protein DMG21_12055 [Acidobacteria bacterium]|nr:MAG: hypothetical protein DMG21_12055 [Acidobacteriota bacterium]
MGGRSLDWRHRRRRFFGPSFGLFTYPFAYPYSYIPSFSEYPLFGPDSSSEQSYQAPAETPGAAQDEGEGDSLSGQVQALTDEVEQMRQERGGGSPASSPSAEPTTRADRLPTVFAFRDGRKLEAVNYVIMGKTLWLVGEQTTRRIPLSDLDLAMSKKLNDERGSECPLSDSN